MSGAQIAGSMRWYGPRVFVSASVQPFFAGPGFRCPRAAEFGCVDGLARVLALLVLLYHFVLYLEVTRLGGVWSRPSLGFVDALGPGSVNLFFMTTGFLFYPRILRGLGSVGWLTLYLSRVFRIIPLVVFTVFASALLTLIRLDFHPHAIGETAIAALRWIACWDQPGSVRPVRQWQTGFGTLVFVVRMALLCGRATRVRCGHELPGPRTYVDRANRISRCFTRTAAVPFATAHRLFAALRCRNARVRDSRDEAFRCKAQHTGRDHICSLLPRCWRCAFHGTCANGASWSVFHLRRV